MLQAAVRDIIHTAYSLARARSFTVVVIASLGIGMGTFVGLVTFVRSMMAPVPGVRTDGLVELLVIPSGPLKARAGNWAIEQWSYPDFLELRTAETGMAITGWAIAESLHQRSEGTEPVRVSSVFVSANYFSTIGISLARGPGFEPAGADALADAPSAGPRVVLGYDFWRNVLSADPDIIGKTITLDEVQHAVVGIAPVGYGGHLDGDRVPTVQLFLPLGRHPRLRKDANALSNPFSRDFDWVRGFLPLPLGVLEPVAYLAAAAIAIVVALLAGLPSARRAASVPPLVAMRSE